MPGPTELTLFVTGSRLSETRRASLGETRPRDSAASAEPKAAATRSSCNSFEFPA